MKWIIEKANEIHRKYDIDDLELLASRFGAEIVEEPLGRIIKEVYLKDLGVIIIDPRLHPYKKRHLIAHGLAHHLFHRNTRVNYFIEERDDRFNYWISREQEKEAEMFAAYLLIPEDKLEGILKEEWVQEHLNPIPELAEGFQVSENFMRKRLEFRDENKC